jgi:hypothetical protein
MSTLFKDSNRSPRRPVVSTSKVNKGDATFSTQKRILGWDIDSANLTISLPPHRVERLEHILHNCLAKKHTTRLQWQKLLGELRSMTSAIHSSVYLFSPLQQLLQKSGKRLRLTQLIRQFLRDWQHLLRTLTQHPVPITSLVPHAPHYVGATDASKTGMGGFWLPTVLTSDNQPCIWRSPFPAYISNALVSTDNKDGRLNNSEFELAAIILGHATQLSTTPPSNYTATFLGTDNTPAQAWIAAGSTSSVKAPAFLLRHLTHDCRLANASLTAIPIAGLTNPIADLLSRSFHLSNDALLQHIQTLFPIQPPWKLVIPPEASVCAMNLALSNKLPGTESPTPESTALTQHGQDGPTSVTPYIKTPGSQRWKTPSQFYKSMLIDTAWERWLPPALLSRLERWKHPFVPWGRRSPHWATRTPGCNNPGASTFAYTDSYNSIVKRT